MSDRPRAMGTALGQGLRGALRPAAFQLAVLVLLSSMLACFLVTRFGPKIMVLGLAGTLVLALLTWVSLKDLSLALVLWMLPMITWRGALLLRMPGLPDFSFDRLFLVWIVLMFVLRLVLQRRSLKGPFTADVLIALHTIYVLVLIQVGESPDFHNWVLSNLSPLFAFFYGKYILEDQRGVRNIFTFFVLVSLYYSVQSIAQHMNWQALIWPKAILDIHIGLFHQGRSRGPVLHPPYFGQLSAILLLVQVFLLAMARRIGARLIFTATALLALLGLFYTYTRGPWVAAAVALMVLAALRPSYRKALAVFAVVAVLASTLGTLQFANSRFLQERVANTDTIGNRLGFLANALRMIRDHPLFGVGYFKFNEVRGQYNQATYIPFYGLVRKGLAAEVPIHDIYIGRTAEEGLISIGLMIAFYLVVLRTFIRRWRSNPQLLWYNRDMLALLAAMMTCYLVGGMIIDYRYFDLVNVLFFLAAGLVCNQRLTEPRAA